MPADKQKTFQFFSALAGYLLIVSGTAIHSVSAGLIVAGAGLLALAYVPRRGN